MSADAWAALGTWATVAVAVAAVVVARHQLTEARDLRREQAQPYVVAFMEQNPHMPWIVEFVVKNFGTTAARDVTVVASPPLRRTDGSNGVEDVWLPPLIPVLVPGQEWRTMWDISHERAQHEELSAETSYRVTTSYRGLGSETLRYVTILDWAAHVGKQWVDVRTVHHGAKALVEIQKIIGKWTDGPRAGLSVFTRDGEAADEAAAERHRHAVARMEEINARLLRRGSACDDTAASHGGDQT